MFKVKPELATKSLLKYINAYDIIIRSYRER